MAEFKSKHTSLSFYVDGVRYDFQRGFFQTEDKEVIAALEKLGGIVERVDEPVKEKPKAKSTKSKSKADEAKN
jgi:hypothetical protein